MEETMRRTASRRNSVSHQRKKVKPVYNYKILRKILRQLMVSGLILLCILSIKNLDTPFAKMFAERTNSFLNSNLDYSWVYKNMNNLEVQAVSLVKSIFPSLFKNGTVPQSPGKQDEKTGNPSEASAEGSNGGGSDEKASGGETLKPVVSSINSSIMDAEAIKSEFQAAIPVNGPVSSEFGLRINPITKKEEFHPGIDIKANQGTPIRAAISGEVIEARRGTSFGNFVRIKSGTDVTTVYAHCHRLNVKSGQKVSRGQTIAEVGNTGMSLGAHLHFEVWRDGRPVDPSHLLPQYQ